MTGFLIGVASSAVVAYFVYRRQRDEQLQAEAQLLQRLTEHGDLLGLAAATSLLTVGSTGRLERDVAVLRRQVMSALDSGETVRHGHVELAQRLVDRDGALDIRLLGELHRLLLAEELDYAGEYRDAAVRIGGSSGGPPGELLPPSPSEVRSRVTELLSQWAQVVETLPRLSVDERLSRIVQFHADLLKVHPFFDGNGLLARVLLATQTERYIGQRVLLPRRDSAYVAALRRALLGDSSELLAYVKRRVERAAQQGDEADER